MNLEIDSDVKTVAQFMQENIPAARLVAVAKAVAEVGGILWGQYEPEPVQALRLSHGDLTT